MKNIPVRRLAAVSIMFSVCNNVTWVQPSALAVVSKPAHCVNRTGTAQVPPGPMPDATILDYDDLRDAPLSISLPSTVNLRTHTTTFNARFEFSLKNGVIYSRLKGQPQWKIVPLPECLRGKVIGISVDEDEMVAIDQSGWIYTMDNALSSPFKWNWMRSWGAPLWLGQGMQLPTTPGHQWALSVISPNTDKTFKDIAGRSHPVAPAKVTQLVFLSGGGSRITYLDPWLPNDLSYEIGGPKEGRLRSVAIASGGSLTMVTNQYGDIFTRLYDFDISGANSIVHRYEWADQDNKREAPDIWAQKVNPKYAAVQLPSPDWVQQPKIPGVITNKLSVHATGPGSDNRELRVEGTHNGHSGYWFKNVKADHWTFTATDHELLGTVLDNTPADRSHDTLVPPSGLNYRGQARVDEEVSLDRYTVSVPNFDAAQTTQKITITSNSGETIPAILHKVDSLRQLPREPGITNNSRTYSAALAIDPSMTLNIDNAGPATKTFISEILLGEKIRTVSLHVTTNRIWIPELSLTLKRV